MVFLLVLSLYLLALLVLPDSDDQTQAPPPDAPTPSSDSENANPPATRSPFPDEGEALTKPIRATRLSSEDQFAYTIDPANIPSTVPWEQASKYVGYTITVEGTIVNVGKSRDGKVYFLNFHHDWRGKFYMVLFNDLAKTLDKPVQEIFEGKHVRVRGKVEPYNGRPQIIVTSMQQVEFVEP